MHKYGINELEKPEACPHNKSGGVVMRPVLEVSRVAELDGLRGAAALSVCIFHYFCMLHPPLAHNMSGVQTSSAVLHTPISAFWNGHLAVMVFFVLSGFVIAASTARKDAPVLVLVLLRYLRLAVPMTAAVVFAWILLRLLPDAAEALAGVQQEPAIWLGYTVQGDQIPPLWWAPYDGFVRSFIVGGSDLNNVLWTMRYELVGSVALIVIYRLMPPRGRIALLVGSALVLAAWNQPRYVAFVLGALLYEAARAERLPRALDLVGIAAAAAGMSIGSLATDTLPRFGVTVPTISVLRSVGYADSFPMLAAASLILLGVLISPSLRRLLCTRIPQYLGRISFGLYLVHVPLLYTIIAFLAVRADLGPFILLPLFVVLALAAGHLLTVAVEVPLLEGLRKVSRKQAATSPVTDRRAPPAAAERGPSRCGAAAETSARE
jgi:peptidoglycan/LPS O-acetylase OafA/YrhL